jgi:hypothetical protein
VTGNFGEASDEDDRDQQAELGQFGAPVVKKKLNTAMDPSLDLSAAIEVDDSFDQRVK